MRKYSILLVVIGCMFNNCLVAQSWTQVQKAVPNDRETDDTFGFDVAVSGVYAIAGATHQREDPQGNTIGHLLGGAYIFERDANGQWVEHQRIGASDGESFDKYGWSVDIDGSYAIVGAYQEEDDLNGQNELSEAGSAYIYERDVTGNWIEVQKIIASDRESGDIFGYSVSISGNYAIVGAPFESPDPSGMPLPQAGSAYLFERNQSGNWVEVQKLTSQNRESGEAFGYSVKVEGDRAVIDADGSEFDAGNGIIR